MGKRGRFRLQPYRDRLSLALLCIALLPRNSDAAPREQLSISQPPSCDTFAPLYEQLNADLAAWGSGTVTTSAALDALQDYADHVSKDELYRYITRVAVVGGRVYLRNPLRRPLGGEGARLAAMLADIVDAVAAADDPAALGDSEFFLHMGDKPVVWRTRLDVFPSAALGAPVLSHCTNDYFNDIAIPIYDYRCGGRSSVDSLYAWRAGSSAADWPERLPVAMGRWSHFCVNATIAFPDRPGLPCPRAQLDKLGAADASGALDLGSTNNYTGYPKGKPYVAMRQQMEGYRYVVTPDGFTCSSKFEKLLLSGAVVLKQESAARGWFYRALKEGKHYVPFFKEPEDLPVQVKWLRENDGEAKRVAASGREWAELNLSKRARSCYMQRVLEGLAQRMGFKPRCGDDGSDGAMQCIPAEEELTSVAVEAFYLHTCDVTLA